MLDRLCMGLLVAVFATSASGASVFSEGFEGPYALPLPEGLSALDPAWTTGGLASAYGASGQLIVQSGKGTAASNGAWEGAGGGLRGNNHAIPGGPLSGPIILEADLHFTGSSPYQDLGSGQFANLVLSADNGPGFVPLINFQADSGGFNIEGGSLGGLPSSISLGSASGRDFHLMLSMDLTAKTLTATVTGDSNLSTGPHSFTNNFVPGNITLVAGRFGNISGTSWDNVTLSAVPEPAGLALLSIGCAALARRRRAP